MNIETSSRQSPASGPKKGLASRRAWHRMSAVIVSCWAIIAIASLIGQHWRPDLDWIGIHAVALGVATNAVVVWSDYFVTALMRTAEPGRARQVIILVILNLGILMLMGGIEAAMNPLILVGALAIIVAGAIHAIGLGMRSKGALTTRFGVVVVRYYVAAAIWFVIACVLGVLMTTAGGAHVDRFLLPHISTSVLGWLGFSVIGTLITLWPTILRTRMIPGVDRDAARALPLLCIAVAASGLGGLIGQGWLAALGLLGYLACLGFTVTAMVKAAQVKPPRSFAARSIIAGMAWLAGTLFVAAIVVVMHPDRQSMINLLPQLAWPLLAGFVAQLIAGSMAYLLPVMMGGGPGVMRHRNAVMDTATDARLIIANGAGLGLLAPLPAAGRTAMIAVLVASVLVYFGLIAACGMARTPREISQDDTMTNRTQRMEWVGGAGVLVLALAVATAVAPGSMVNAGSGTSSTSGTSASTVDAPVRHVSVDAHDMSFTPNQITVEAGTQLIIDVTNTDSTGTVHDLVLPSGATSGRLMPGSSGSVDAGVITESQQGWCSIAGHKQMGMTLDITVEGQAQAGTSSTSNQDGTDNAAADPNASMSVEPFDARLQPASDETEHHYTFDVTEEQVEVAPGVTQTRWTYNGQTPGPVLRGHLGDTFVITLTNSSTMGHSIDFHAGALAPVQPMRTIAPGETLTYTFTAEKSGIWMYHCSTSPMSLHITNGMYGAVIIDPPGLSDVDEEYLIVQSETWYGPQGESADADRVGDANPDAVVFNGYAFQYDTYPLTATTGDRVRFWVLDVGPDEPLAFHVVGAQFDTTWREGAFNLECGYQPSESVDASCSSVGPGGSQVLSLAAAEGGYVEMIAPEAGHFKLVNHIMTNAEKGAHGTLEVTDP